MDKKFKMAAPCGLICDECPWYNGKMEENCPGCLNKKGKPFWGECEVFLCNEMQKTEFCGICKEFPCDTIINHYDPNNKRGREEAIFRIGQLSIRAKIGTEKWLENRFSRALVSFNENPDE